MKVKQFRNRPDVLGEASGHGRCAAMALGVGQGVVGRTEVVHRADQVHAQGQHALAPGAIAGTPHQAGQAGAEGGIQALDVGGVQGLPPRPTRPTDHSGPLRRPAPGGAQRPPCDPARTA